MTYAVRCAGSPRYLESFAKPALLEIYWTRTWTPDVSRARPFDTRVDALLWACAAALKPREYAVEDVTAAVEAATSLAASARARAVAEAEGRRDARIAKWKARDMERRRRMEKREEELKALAARIAEAKASRAAQGAGR